jgi:hypothetical protein
LKQSDLKNIADNKLAGIDSRFRFIPFRRRDVVEMCLADDKLTTTESDFRQLADMLTQIFTLNFTAFSRR